MARKKLTVYIGRFQPFHLGHVSILEQAIKESDHVLVLIGSAFAARTIKNPFTFHERAEMINNWAPVTTNTLSILPLRDQRYNNAKWIQSVQEAVDASIFKNGWKRQDVDVRLTGSHRDDSTSYLSSFPQYESALKPEVPGASGFSATTLRLRLFSQMEHTREWWPDVPGSTFAFLRSFFKSPDYVTLKKEFEFNVLYSQPYENLKYPPTFNTADAVIIQSGHVLVVKRGALPGIGLWALPGGFVKKHQTTRTCAIAEAIEETGIQLATGKRAKEITASILDGSIKCKEFFEDPARSLRGRTFTMAYLMRLDDNKPLPVVKGQFAPLEDTDGIPGIVETADAFWLPISVARANSEMWFEDHLDILDTMLGMIKD